jgi:hypothetical protein
MTVLFSSAGSRLRLVVQITPSGWSAAQLIARVRMSRVDSRYSAALSASAVWPEREINTGWQGDAPFRRRSGNSRISEAGTALARSPVNRDQLAAAARAM